MEQPKISEAQARILGHMNKDHKLAVEDYLAVYGEVKVDNKIANIILRDIELDHMSIGFNHFDIEFEIMKVIELDPPLESFKQARERLVTMAKHAAKARGYSHFQINEMSYANCPYDYAIVSLVLLAAAAYFFPALVFGVLAQAVPGSVIEFLKSITARVFYATVVIHLAETLVFMVPLLKKYRVPLDFKLEWLVASMLEGYGAKRRFMACVKEKESHSE